MVTDERASAVVGYVRVSTDEQANGYGLSVQRERIEQFCRQERGPQQAAAHRDWDSVDAEAWREESEAAGHNCRLGQNSNRVCGLL